MFHARDGDDASERGCGGGDTRGASNGENFVDAVAGNFEYLIEVAAAYIEVAIWRWLW